jgi:hypothetical protein
MKISSFTRTNIARSALGVAAAGAVAVASLGVVGTAQARSVRCDAAGHCTTYCTQTLANGNVIEYTEGTNITVTSPDGHEYKYTCKNGNWVATTRTVQLSGKVNLGTAVMTTR